MEGFVRALAREQSVERHPFVVVNVDPGVVQTGMHDIAAGGSVAEVCPQRTGQVRRAGHGVDPVVQFLRDEAAQILGLQFVDGERRQTQRQQDGGATAGRERSGHRRRLSQRY